MSLPHDTRHDDDTLEQYVLGMLPHEDAERLDEASIVDDEVAARLRVVETDLIDDYVRGKLAGEKLERFESYYLSSPRRRERVRLAASFVRAVDRPLPIANVARLAARIARSPRVAAAMAAAALVVVVSGFSLFEFVRPPRNESAVATSGRAVADSRTQGLQPLAEPRPLVTVELPPPLRAVAAMRAVVIPAGADHLRFELRLESDDFPEYRVALRNLATSQVLWRSDWGAASARADRASVFVVVPAALFGTERYSLDLAGRASGGRAEMIGSYTIRTAQP
jgi:hypothetical protein